MAHYDRNFCTDAACEESHLCEGRCAECADTTCRALQRRATLDLTRSPGAFPQGSERGEQRNEEVGARELVAP